MGENTGGWIFLVFFVLTFVALIVGPAWLSASQMEKCIDRGGSWVGGNCLLPPTIKHEGGA